MAKRHEGLPNVVFVGNAKRRIKHNLVLFKVIETFEDGSPKICVRIKDDETANLKGGEAFITAYVQHQVVEKET